MKNLRFQPLLRNAAAAILVVAIVSAAMLSPVTGSAQTSTVSEDKVWEHSSASQRPAVPAGATALPDTIKGQMYRLNADLLLSQLAAAPHEDDRGAARGARAEAVIYLPTPDGSFERFAVEEMTMMEPALAQAFPTFKTYTGRSLDDKGATAAISWTALGFHAQVRSPANGVWLVDPYTVPPGEFYVSHRKSDAAGMARENFSCLVAAAQQEMPDSAGEAAPTSSGGVLRNYRLAVAATGEYTQAVGGGTVAGGQAAIVTAIRRVNQVYEQEVAVRFLLIANNQQVVYTNRNTDPYTGSSDSDMMNENQANLDAVFGNDHYHIGHVFTAGRNAGLAQGGCVCDPARKAMGVTGGVSPTGDPFWVDYVAHEIGHQFNASHTFNNNTDGGCAGANRRVAHSAYEPGSGSTIMGYAGLCSPDDLQPNSHDNFHFRSYDQMRTFIVSGGGNSCGTSANTTNTPPTANAGSDYTIPIGTPFVLTGSGSDPDTDDKLTYSWEQRDLGPAQRVTAPDNGSSPLFRAWAPTTDPKRYFPRLPDLLNNTAPFGEQLPSVSRTMKFRLTVRDNRDITGGIGRDDMQVNVVAAAGPFQVTAPNTVVNWPAGSRQTVSWSVAGTNGNGINAQTVDILLSTDGGYTFPIVLASGTANDGSEEITVPIAGTSHARIKVQPTGNIFFDISDANFFITIPPQVIVDTPPHDATINSLTSIEGSAVDPDGQGLQGAAVQITLYHVNSASFWNGSSWSSSTASFSAFVNATDNRWATTRVPTEANVRSGQFTLSVSARDGAGNASLSQPGINQITFRVDASAPTVTITSPQNGSFLSSPGYVFTGRANDSSGISHVVGFIRRNADYQYWNGSTWVTDPLQANLPTTYDSGATTWSCTANLPQPGTDLSGGSYNFIAIAFDNAGNSAQTDSFITLDDNAPPQVAVTTPGYNAAVKTLTIFGGTASDLSGIKNNEVVFTLYHVPTGQFWTGSSWSGDMTALKGPVVGTNWSYGAVPTGSNLRNGQYLISASARDNAGTASVPTPGVNQTSFVIDNSPPNVAILDPEDGSSITTRNYSFSGTASDNTAISRVILFIRRNADGKYWNGSTWITEPLSANLLSTYNSSNNTWSLSSNRPIPGSDPVSRLVNGSYNFIAIAIDTAGNQKQTDSEVTVDYHRIVNWTGGFGTSWDDARNWSSPDGDGGPDANSIVTIQTNVHVQTDQSRTVYQLRLLDGHLQFTNSADRTLTTTHKSIWNGGRFTGTWEVSPGASVELGGAGVKFLSDSSIINNHGTMTWTGPGAIQAQGEGYSPNPVINNKAGGLFQVMAGGTLFSRWSVRDGTPVLNNEANARFVRTEAPGSRRSVNATGALSVISVFRFNNSGALECTSGRLAFNTDAHFVNAEPMSGAGVFELQGGTLTVTGNFVLENTLFRLDVGNFYSALGATANIITVGNGMFQMRGGGLNRTIELSEGSRMQFVDPESGPVVKWLSDGLDFTNRGIIQWMGGGMIMAQGEGHVPNPVISNKPGARFEINGDGQIFTRWSHRHGSPLFANEPGAKLIKTSGNGTLTLTTFELMNLGEIRVDSGTLALNTHTTSGTAATYVGPGSYEQIGGQLILIGTFPISGGATFSFRGGEIRPQNTPEGVQLVAPAGKLRLHGGHIFGKWIVPQGSFLEISDAPQGAIERRLRDGFVLDNYGTVTWKGGAPIQVQGENYTPVPVINNKQGGVFQAEGDGTLFSRWSVRDGTPAFHNEPGATFAKTAGADTLTFNTFSFHNSGNIQAASGVVAFNTTFDWNNGTALAGPGTFEMRGGRLNITGTLPVEDNSSLRIFAGEVVPQGAAGAQLVAASGRLFLHGGYFYGRHIVPAGSFLEISDPTSGPLIRRFMDGLVLDNHGTVTWHGGSSIQVQGEGHAPNPIFNNKAGGVFRALGDQTLFSRWSVRAGTPTFRNESGATFTKSGGSGTLNVTMFDFINRGAVTNSSGVLAFNTKLDQFSQVSFTGTGTFEFTAGRLELDGALPVEDTTFTIRAGDIVGHANGTASFITSGAGRIVLLGGSYFGKFTLPAGSELELDDPSTGPVAKFFGDGSVFDNFGTFTMVGAGTLRADGWGHPNLVFNNKPGGVFRVLRGGPIFSRSSVRDGMPVFNNAASAQFIKNSPGTGEFKVFALVNDGDLIAQGGPLEYDTTLTLNNETIFDGDGRHQINTGIVNLTGNITTATDLTLWNAELRGNGDGGWLHTAGDGVIRWLGGVIRGKLALAANSLMHIGDRPGDGSVKFLYDGSIIENHGTMIWSGNGHIQAEGQGFALNPQFTNMATGTFHAAPAAGRINRWSYRDGTPLFTNAGVMNIGSSAGILRFEGWNFVQSATGMLNIKVAGTNAVTPEFDQLRIDRHATLGGIINVVLLNDFTFVPGTTLNPVSFASRAGTFGEVHSLGSVLEFNYTNTQVTMTAKEFPENNKEWSRYFFGDPNAPEAQPLADPDGDGITNLQEAAFARDPRSGGGAVVSIGSVGPQNRGGSQSPDAAGERYATISFIKPAGAVTLSDILYVPERSTTLGVADWGTSGLVLESEQPLNKDGTLVRQTWRSTSPMSVTPREFLRVKVSLVP
jgi:hypothetical protein